MRKHYYLLCVLLLSLKLMAQPCTLTEADLLTAPAGNFTIPAGAILCINANFCMGIASNLPGSCANANVTSLTINGTLRIASNVTFGLSATIDGSGEIVILDRGRINFFGAINCANGLEIYAIDRTLISGNSSVAMPGCGSPACEPTFSDGYAPFGVVPTLGYASTGCTVTGRPRGIPTLPVSLTGFNGTVNGNIVELVWKTVSEQNNKGFEVQRNKDANNWEYAGWVSSKAADGNSSATLDYSFADNDPGSFNHINYRLKQVDFNMHASYSPVIRIEALKTDTWRVNVSGSNIYLQVQSTTAENVVISVVSTSGSTLYTGKYSLNAGSNLLEIPAGNYVKGLHVVSLQRSGGSIQREKILLR